MISSVLLILPAVLVFGIIHSLSASLWMKALAEKRLGLFADRFYRITYNLVTILFLVGILGLVIQLPDVVLYRIPFPWAVITLFIQVIASICVLVVITQTGMGSFLGLRQVLKTNQEENHISLTVTGFYRWMRHPAYTFGLLIIWLFPVMTVNIFTFNLASSLYIWVGIYFEERKLVREFGQAYSDYQKSTSKLIPPFL